MKITLSYFVIKAEFTMTLLNSVRGSAPRMFLA